jgi:NAD(P)-dependent dehydrogenase (short-subunit alcohol dehydrogenase family)
MSDSIGSGPGDAASLRGRVAFVTGGGGPAAGAASLGQAIAIRLAERGAAIFILDQSEPAARATGALVGKIGVPWAHFTGDVSSESAVRDAVGDCVARLGGLDILVNNAGIGALGGPVETAEADWDRVMGVNLKAMYLTCRHALPVMLGRKRGAIVNISSLASLGYTGRPLLAYSVSKAGVNQVTREVALQYARSGIRANTVVVGMIDTPMIRRYVEMARGELTVEQVMAARSDQVPMGRQGSVQEVAAAAAWLASDESAFITGTELIVDGGASARCV